MSTAPGVCVCVCVCVCVHCSRCVCVCVCVHCSRCVSVCVSTAPGVYVVYESKSKFFWGESRNAPSPVRAKFRCRAIAHTVCTV